MKRAKKNIYNYLWILTFLIIIVLPGSAFSQHHHNNNDTSFTEIFSNESSFGKISIYSNHFPLEVKKNIEFDLNMKFKDTLMKLNMEESKITSKKMKGNDIYNFKFTAKNDNITMFKSLFIFNKSGDYKFDLKLIIEDSTGAKYLANFAFTQNVINNDEENADSHHGFMGMGTEMWLIMGGVMIAMMAVVFMISSNHR